MAASMCNTLTMLQESRLWAITCRKVKDDTSELRSEGQSGYDISLPTEGRLIGDSPDNAK